MSGIFISYRREESAAYAGRVSDWVSKHFRKQDIFIDVDSIQPGEDFVSAIEEKVALCDALVALIGKDWLNCKDEEGKRRLDNADDFVRVEIGAALARNIRVIPVLVDGARMPRSTELPEPLVRLARRNALELSHTRFHQDVERLIDALEKALRVAEEGRAVAAAAQAEAETAATEAARKPAEEAAARERAAAEESERNRAAEAKQSAEPAARERAAEEAERDRAAEAIQAGEAARERAAAEEAERKRVAEAIQGAEAARERAAGEELQRQRVAEAKQAVEAAAARERAAAEELERIRVAEAKRTADEETTRQLAAATELQRNRIANARRAAEEATARQRAAAEELQRNRAVEARRAAEDATARQRAAETNAPRVNEQPPTATGEFRPETSWRLRLAIVGLLAIAGGVAWYVLSPKSRTVTVANRPTLPVSDAALDEIQIAGLLAAKLPAATIAAWISRDGITFVPSTGSLTRLRGPDAAVVQAALPQAKRYQTRVRSSDGAVLQHLVSAAESRQRGLDLQARDEFRQALDADQDNAVLHLALGALELAGKTPDRIVIVSIGADGNIMINNEPTSMNVLGSRLNEIFKTRAERSVFVRVDSRRSYPELAKVVQTTRGAGIDRIALWQESMALPWLKTRGPSRNERPEAPPTKRPATIPEIIPVGGNVQQAKLIKRGELVYPPAAKQARVQGSVQFGVVIGTDGAVEEITFLSGHPFLTPAAEAWVKTLVYQPTLLQGKPVKVKTQVIVNFTLDK